MINDASHLHLADIGKTVRAARKAMRLSQTQVSEQIAVSRKTLSRIEAGSIHDIGVQKLMGLCNLLNLELLLRERAEQRYPTLQELRLRP